MNKKDLKVELVAAYDNDAQRRNDNADSRNSWKVATRKNFADFIQAEHKTTVLEIGAGAGLDSVYFQDRGFDILATDISPKMVDTCKYKALNAVTLDLYDLGTLQRQFDAIYSMNVLLHVPKKDLGQVLATIHEALTPNGIFFYGVYGGINKETVFTDSRRMNLPRFFSFLDDAKLQQAVLPLFEIINADVLDVGETESGLQLHFQSLLLRKR